MTEKKKIKSENRFTKEQVLASKKLTYSKDLINVVLSEGKRYSLEEVEKEIQAFLKRKVN